MEKNTQNENTAAKCEQIFYQPSQKLGPYFPKEVKKNNFEQRYAGPFLCCFNKNIF